MEPGSVSRTALGAAIVRALESYRPQNERLFDDPLARGFVNRGILALLRLPIIGSALLAMRERQFPGAMGNLLCRTRFIDDALRDALAKGLDQVVILGAGFDTRPYRVQGIDATSVFEVDHPATQAVKQERLKRMLGTLPSHVTFVPVDFDRQQLDEAMTAAGFRAGRRTFLIWEGVTQYITAEAADATFRYVSRTASAGSEIVFTYIHRGIIDGSVTVAGGRRMLARLERVGEPWIFGIDPTELGQYLAARGLTFVQDVGEAEYRARYLDPLGRRMNVFEGERVVLAQVADPRSGAGLRVVAEGGCDDCGCE